MQRKGYTLTELVIVISIIILLSAMAMIYIGFSRAMNLSAVADKVAADLKYAQSLSMSTATWHGVSFEADPISRYTVFMTVGTLDSLAKDPADFSRDFVVNLSDKFSIAISSVSIGGGNRVAFSPLGAPYTAKTGSVISSEGTVILRAGSDVKTIRITPNTGRIIIQ